MFQGKFPALKDRERRLQSIIMRDFQKVLERFENKKQGSTASWGEIPYWQGKGCEC